MLVALNALVDAISFACACEANSIAALLMGRAVRFMRPLACYDPTQIK